MPTLLRHEVVNLPQIADSPLRVIHLVDPLWLGLELYSHHTADWFPDDLQVGDTFQLGLEGGGGSHDLPCSLNVPRLAQVQACPRCLYQGLRSASSESYLTNKELSTWGYFHSSSPVAYGRILVPSERRRAVEDD